ncbi:MFS transporter [Reinekea marinisedimentorum]|uniref:Putative MFS family arabinose efflux permease n=1 Tax=Reinekea marinisedimentorum TaxID=230495 RepID=A0A4R3HRS4_9GAMM|nr:MFS transporter [Reinekea marinisedimentorum]TCS35682.1 putative MFS family arabinose efflux permease [Reinekea marinisedimentorum]
MNLRARLSSHYLILGLSQGILLCVITLFMTEKGLQLGQIGVAYGVYSATTMLLELPLGAAADLYGRIRVFRWSLLINVGSLLLATFSEAYVLILAALSLMGAARALESGSVSAWEIEQIRSVGEENMLTSYLSRFQALNAIGIAIGALLGGYIPDLFLHHFPGYILPASSNLLVVAAITSLHILLLPFLFREGDTIQPRQKKTNVIEQIKAGILHGTHNHAMRSLLSVSVCLGMVLSTLEAYWQPYLKALATPGSYALFGWVTTGYFLSAAIGPAFYSFLDSRVNVKSSLTITAILSMSAVILFALSNTQSTSTFAVSYFSFMAIFTCIHIPVNVMLNLQTNDNVRSTTHSIMSLTLHAGSALAAFGFAPIVQAWGIASVWRLLAGFLLTFAISRQIKWRQKVVRA